jgi:Leucine-rich repeat (LRR) protein
MPPRRLSGDGVPDGLRRDDPAYVARNLPATLAAAVEAEGGLWWASDYYLTASQVVEEVHRRGVAALRLDFRDLSLLEELPQVRHLYLSSDGRPVLDPVASLTGLRSLLVNTSALRGDLDPLAFPDLRWLRLSLGGKGGAAVLPAIQRGHPALAHLEVKETKSRTLAELIAGFPRLRHVGVSWADRLRTLGDLAPVRETLTGLSLYFTQLSSLDGIEVLQQLEEFRLVGGRVTDLAPLAGLSTLRTTDVQLGEAGYSP